MPDNACNAGIAPSYSFLVYAAAVGAYFKGGQLAPIDLVVEERFHRAAPGGTGGTKAAGNYTPVRRGFAPVALPHSRPAVLRRWSACSLS